MNKFKKIFFGFVFILFFLVSKNVFADTSNISALVFTTDIQNVKPGEISGEIIVQTQNFGGTAEKVSETNDVTFTSTSGTGVFLNSSGNAVSLTMSKNTSSRTFYYKDENSGEFNITINIKGRETNTSFSATQKIIIGNNISSQNTNTTNSTSSSVNDTNSSTSNTSSGEISTHSNQASLSSASPEFDLKISAGRKRMAIVGAEVYFDAPTEIKGDFSGTVSYDWSFGDGAGGGGKNISHIYRFPGSYNVILNANTGGVSAVSRTDIQIVEAEISIKDMKEGKGGFIEIANNSSYETNIGGFRLFFASSTKIIPKDTIIKSKSSIKIPADIFAKNIELQFPEGDRVASLAGGQTFLNEENNKEILAELVRLREVTSRMYLASENSQENIITGNFNIEKNLLSNSTTTLSQENNSSTSSDQSPNNQTAALLNAFENHEEKDGWIRKSFRFIKNLFGK